MTNQPQPIPDGLSCPFCGEPLLGRYCIACGADTQGGTPPEPPPPAWRYGGDPGGDRAKRRRWPVAFLCLVGVLTGILALAAACWGGSALGRHLGGVPPVEIPNEIPPPDPPYDYGYGYLEDYSNETNALRVDSMGSYRTPGTEAFPAPEGKEYLVVSLRLTNLYGSIIRYGAENFELAQASGNLLSARSTDIDASTALEEGRLLPGGTVEGTVVFLVPRDEIGFVLYVQDDTFGESLHFPLI